MGNKLTDVSGWNARYDDKRFTGAHGAHGANIFPYETNTSVVATDPAGIYDSEGGVPDGSIVSQVKINVTEGFEGSGPVTLRVGTTGDDDAVVTLADAVDLTTTGLKVVTRETIWPAGSVVRATIGGEEISAGSANITVAYSV